MERGSVNLIQSIYDVGTGELSNTLQVPVHDSGLGTTLRDVQDPRRASPRHLAVPDSSMPNASQSSTWRFHPYPHHPRPKHMRRWRADPC